MPIPANISIGESVLFSPEGADKNHVYFCLMESSPEQNALVLLAPMWTYDIAVQGIKVQSNNRIYYGEHPFCKKDTISWINHSAIKRQNKNYVLGYCERHYPRITEVLYARIIKNFLTDVDRVPPKFYEWFEEMRTCRKIYCQSNPCDDFCERAFFSKKKN